MSDKKLRQIDDKHPHCYVMDGKLALPYQYFAGRTGSRFLIALRDKKQIMGIKCEKCNKVFVPPRQTCERCLSDISDNWVELSGDGEVVNFTVVRKADRHLPREVPYVLAMVKLEGADTPMPHILDVDPDKVEIGMKVKPVFAAETTNTILDIECFQPA